MGKVKSAIVTTIVIVAIVAATFFAVVSFPYRGGTYRWNSILSVIPLGSEFSGDAECVIYPEGIITEAEYQLYSAYPEDDDYLDDDANDQEKKDDTEETVNDFIDQYVYLGNGLYIDTDEYEVEFTEVDGRNVVIEGDVTDEIKENVKSDAETISKRLGRMDFSSYSVAVVNDYGLKIGVPTGYTYSDMRHEDYLNEESSSATKLSQLSSVVTAIVLDGELTICVSDKSYGGYDPADSDLEYYPITRKTDSMSEYIKSVKTYSRGGSDALKFKLTSDGRELVAEKTNVLLDSDDPTLYFCVGSDVLMSLSIDSMIDSKKFYITISDELGAKSYASVLNSVVNGEVVNYSYSSADPNSESISLTANTMENGQFSALAMVLVALVVLIVLCAISVAKYKKLGWLNVAMLLIFSLLMIYVVYLLRIEITIASMLCGMLCLGVFAGTNFIAFENVRSRVSEGDVMRNARRNGYKKNRAGILDAHIILFVIAFVLYLVGKGALSASGLILTFGFVISYLMYWFTRLMWYCCSSGQKKNEFEYCGFQKNRRVIDDED